MAGTAPDIKHIALASPEIPRHKTQVFGATAEMAPNLLM